MDRNRMWRAWRWIAGLAVWIGVAAALPAQAGDPPAGEPPETVAKAPETAPPTPAEIAAAVQRSVALIVEDQERYEPDQDRQGRGRSGGAAKAAAKAPEAERREWPYEGVYRVAPGVIPPGYRVGGTAICCHALLEAPGFEDDAPRRAAFDRGVAFILDALEKDKLLDNGFLGTYDVRGWAHAYALSFLLRALERDALKPEVAKAARTRAQTLVIWLQDTEIPETGGWNYSRRSGRASCPASTFMTAPTLQALFAARKRGLAVDPAVVKRALKTLEDARLESGAFQYGSNPDRRTGEGNEAVPGACARMAACETTLLLAGRGSVDRVRGAVEAFFEHWEWLEKRRRQSGTHVPPYMIAPYYFHYAHTYVAQAIEQLPEAERPGLREKLHVLYWRTREEGGGWNDRVFKRSENFGCAMVILGLLMPELPEPARWQ